MNYRHIFHAGNRCDVVKHTVLTLLVKHLLLKDKAFLVLDTHAGTGLYDLKDDRALKTNEADDGIQKLITSPLRPALDDYYAVLQKLNPLWDQQVFQKIRVYPGSPLLAFHLLRPQDRLIACELHPEDAKILRLHCPNDNRLQIHHRDGYEALGAFLPPLEKRGLVLIDPPFEETNEFSHILKNIKDAHRRWPMGIYMIWYPIKDRPAIWNFHESLSSSGIKKILSAEFIYENEQAYSDRLIGSGMVIINSPWTFDEKIRDVFASLHRAMDSPSPTTNIKWLTEETQS